MNLNSRKHKQQTERFLSTDSEHTRAPFFTAKSILQHETNVALLKVAFPTEPPTYVAIENLYVTIWIYPTVVKFQMSQ